MEYMTLCLNSISVSQIFMLSFTTAAAQILANARKIPEGFKQIFNPEPITIGVIGAGNLGVSIIRMLGKNFGDVIADRPYNVVASVKTSERKQKLDERFKNITLNNKEVVAKSHVIILCVKPGQIKDVCEEINTHLLPNTIVISTAAVVSLDKLCEWLPRAEIVVRCMPNILCSIGGGVVTYYSKHTDASQIMNHLFLPNTIISLDSDKQLDDSTLISGCGPAFYSWYFECLSKIDTDIPKEKLNTMLAQTMTGTSHMLNKFAPHDIITLVSSPKGVTEFVLDSFNDNKLDEEINIAFKTAQRRIDDITSTL